MEKRRVILLKDINVVPCPKCGKIHKLTYPSVTKADGTKITNKEAAMVICTDGISYLVGLSGKLKEGIWRGDEKS